MARREEYLAKWIHSVLVGQIRQTKEKDCTDLLLMHLVGESETEVMRTKLGSGSQSKPLDYANMFLEAAREDAHALPGSQLYCIKAFFGNDYHEGRHVFQVVGEAQGEEGFVTEPANATGKAMQTMRHTETLHGLYIRGISTTQEETRRFIGEQGRLLLDTMQENREMLIAMKDMLMKEGQEQHAMRMKEVTFVRNAELMKSIAELFGPILNTLTGKEIVPMPHVYKKIFEQIADKVENQEQLLVLQGFLGPELGALVTNELTTIMERRAKERKALEDAVRAKGSPLNNGQLPAELTEGEGSSNVQ
jgi:hypothetical protein